MPLFPLIVLASVLVTFTILAAIVTGSEIQRQRAILTALDHELLEVEDRLGKFHDQRTTVVGILELHVALREEKVRKIKDLMQQLEWLEGERVAEREIKVASGLRQKAFEDASGQG